MYVYTVYVLVATCISTVLALTEFTYDLDGSQSGTIPSGTEPLSVRSLADCATTCTSDMDCIGFYYSNDQSWCFLHTAATFSTFQSDASSQYFLKSAVSNAGPTMVSSSSCPSTPIPDVWLYGNSGNHYTFKIVLGNFTKSEAATTCVDFGMKLIKVNDQNKILDMADFLATCSVYHFNGYWTDFEYQMSEVGTPWRNSDGSELDSVNVWCHGKSGDSSVQTCSRMRRSHCSYLLNNKECDSLIPAICE